MPKAPPTTPDSRAEIEGSIIILRGQRVILDIHLARIYGTHTKRLNEQVKRNIKRFPEDFMFRLSPGEASALNWSQLATTSQRHRRAGFTPFAFTEHGAVMAATVLNTRDAIEMSLYVVRAFIRLRQLIASNAALRRKLSEIESRLEAKLLSHENAIAEILAMLRSLMRQPDKGTRGIGFTADL